MVIEAINMITNAWKNKPTEKCNSHDENRHHPKKKIHRLPLIYLEKGICSN
jgi:hypothetical protein